MENKLKYCKSDINVNKLVSHILNNRILRNRSKSNGNCKYSKDTNILIENAPKLHYTMEMSCESDESEDIPCKKRRVQRVKKSAENKSPQSEYSKRKFNNINSNDIISPLKRLKIHPPSDSSSDIKNTQVPDTVVIKKEIIDDEESTSTSKNVQSSNASKFIEACQIISRNEFYDIKSRLGISTLPDCCIDPKHCQKNHGKSKVNLYEMLSHEQEAFKINFNAKMWTEALNVCKDVLRPNKYPNVENLLCIIEIILNSHSDPVQKQPLHMILQRCLSTFKLYFTTHPPCAKVIRRLYINFLTKSLKKHNDNIKYTKNGGIFEFVLDELQEILKCYSCSESVNTTTKIDTKCDISLSLSEAYLLKTEQETYATLSNVEKIKRLFFVLDIIVDLLERDLAIWITAYNHGPNKFMFGPHKPLMAWVLWNENPFYTGTVNSICRQIFRLFTSLIKLDFPSTNIRIFSRLINVMSNTYYLCEGTTECIYPNIGKHMTTFADEMFKIIKDENFVQIMKIVSQIESKCLKYFLTSAILKTFVNTDKENFIELILHIFQEKKWLSFPESSEINSSFKRKLIQKNFPTTETKRIFARILTKLKLSKKVNDDIKLNNSSLKTAPTETSMQMFLLVLYASLKSYLDLYNVENIQVQYNSPQSVENRRELRDRLLNNEYEKSEKQFASNYNSQILLISKKSDERPCLTLSEDCLKQYRLIFRILKQIVTIYADLKTDRRIHDLFKYIQIIQ